MVYQFNAVIHQVDHPSLMQSFIMPVGSVPTIHVSFHLNEHYNSVRRGDDPCTRGISPITQYPIGHNLEAIKALLKDQVLDLAPVLEQEEATHKSKKKQQRAAEVNEIPYEVLNYAKQFVGAKDPDMTALQNTLEEYFSERNLSKLKLNDIDHNKKKIKKEYNEQVLLALANLKIEDKDASGDKEKI